MSRYIDADAFVKNMSEIKESTLQNHSLKRGNEPIDGYDADFLRAIGLAKQLVDEFPATDVRPNVRGEWRKVADKAEHITYECVFCGAKVHVARNVVTPNFCSRCGADMRGEE